MPDIQLLKNSSIALKKKKKRHSGRSYRKTSTQLTNPAPDPVELEEHTGQTQSGDGSKQWPACQVLPGCVF